MAIHLAMTRLVVVAVATMWAGSALARCPPAVPAGTPAVRAEHIFCGEVRWDGRAVGFHSRPGGINPESVSDTDEARPDPRRPGIYTLFRFRISAHGRDGIKTVSTMFPDHCDADAVIAAVRHAYRTGKRGERDFHGLSGPTCQDRNGKPFQIEGYTDMRNGTVVITTAYPGR